MNNGMTVSGSTKPARTLIGLAIMSASVLGGMQQSNAQSREWSASGLNQKIVVADCRDCGDDIGMMVECRGQTQPALVTVHWAASETGQDQAATRVSVEADGQFFRRKGRTAYFGQIGYVPTFELRPNDPMIAALQAGRSVRISSGNGQADISLRGSREAFDIFKVHCGWNKLTGNAQSGTNQPQGNKPTGQLPNNAGTNGTEVPNQDGTQWFVTEYDAATNGKSGASLTFGIPETDAIALNATCEAGNPGPYIPIMTLVDIAGRPHGVPAQIQVQAGGFQQAFQGTVSALSEEYAGVQIAVPVDDPFWSVLISGRLVSLGMPGNQSVTLSAPGSVGAISRFLDQCRTTFRG